ASRGVAGRPGRDSRRCARVDRAARMVDRRLLALHLGPAARRAAPPRRARRRDGPAAGRHARARADAGGVQHRAERRASARQAQRRRAAGSPTVRPHLARCAPSSRARRRARRPRAVRLAPAHAYRGATTHLSVRDDGPGMDPGAAARCTEAFYTTKPKDHGTGLGLFLARTVVERHGGKLLVDSTLGEGTTFTLVLP